MTDPLIEEARKAGQAYIDSFGGDLKAVCADLRRRAREEGRAVGSLPPKPPRDGTVSPALPQKAAAGVAVRGGSLGAFVSANRSRHVSSWLECSGMPAVLAPWVF